jgi:hypothetical protein
MGYVSKKNFFKIFLLNKVYFPNFANNKQIYFEPCVDYSLVTTVLGLRDLKFGMCIKDHKIIEKSLFYEAEIGFIDKITS